MKNIDTPVQAEVPETKHEEKHLVVEVPTEITAGAEPVCRMCCNGPHAGPPR